MIILWFFTNYAAQIVYLVAGLWLLNGLRKVIFKPRIRVIAFTKTKAGEFIETERQQLLPPWLTFRETWMAEPDQRYCQDYSWHPFTDYLRETDGVALSATRFKPFGVPLSLQLTSALAIKKAREAETEELLKEERPRART